VLSPNNPLLIIKVLTAPARSARELRSVASCQASRLKGTVMFRPLPLLSAKAATASEN